MTGAVSKSSSFVEGGICWHWTQAACDWKELLPGQLRADPPDELIMTKPQVDACGNVFGDF